MMVIAVEESDDVMIELRVKKIMVIVAVAIDDGNGSGDDGNDSEGE